MPFVTRSLHVYGRGACLHIKDGKIIYARFYSSHSLTALQSSPFKECNENDICLPERSDYGRHPSAPKTNCESELQDVDDIGLFANTV